MLLVVKKAPTITSRGIQTNVHCTQIPRTISLSNIKTLIYSTERKTRLLFQRGESLSIVHTYSSYKKKLVLSAVAIKFLEENLSYPNGILPTCMYMCMLYHYKRYNSTLTVQQHSDPTFMCTTHANLLFPP